MFKGEAYSLKKFGEKSILRAVIILKFDFLKYSLNDTLTTREQTRSPRTGRCRRSYGNTESSPKQRLATAHCLHIPYAIQHIVRWKGLWRQDLEVNRLQHCIVRHAQVTQTTAFQREPSRELSIPAHSPCSCLHPFIPHTASQFRYHSLQVLGIQKR